MNEPNMFDHEPDAELGAVLREALDRAGEDVFVRQVIARLDDATNPLEILGAWARPGLVAALFLSAVAGFWLGRHLRPPVTPVAVEDVLTAGAGNGSMTALISSDAPPTVEVLFETTNSRP